MSDLALETGTYSITGVTFLLPTPVSRPVAAVRATSRVVLLPAGSLISDSKWEIERLTNGNYYIKTLGNHYARPAPEAQADIPLIVVENDPFEWDIKHATRLPPPIGDNSFHIQVPGLIRPPLSWALPDSDSGNAGQQLQVFVRRAEFPSELHISPFRPQ